MFGKFGTLYEEFILTQGNNAIAMRNNLWEKITENVCE